MFVEKWMTPEPATVQPDETISAVALEMNRRKFRHFPVCEPTRGGARLVGIVAKYDIARAFPKNLNPFSPEVTEDTVAEPISTIMVRNIVTVEPSCALEEAARIFRARRINALPVVRAGNLIGIITESDVFDALLNMTGANSHGVKLVVESNDVATTLGFVAQLTEQYRLNILDASSFHDHLSANKVFSAFHFSSRPNEQFIQQLCARGYRLVKLG